MKEYEYNGLKGCVFQRKCRKTRSIVGVYNAKQCGIEAEYEWITVCEKHGVNVSSEKRADAISLMVDPMEWCTECRIVKYLLTPAT